MADYEPLDISGWCNATLDALEAEEEPAAGAQAFRGLPFLVGGLVSLAQGAPPVIIPIGGPARRIIFAHTQLETTVAEDGRWGRHVADYVFRTADGGSESVPIRERFEIGVLPGRGTVPGGITSQFRAVSDSQPELQPRYEGEFGRAGWRLMESTGESARWYYLWAWRNPNPDVAVESVELVPRGPRFAVAAITLGHADEHPFAREGRVPVRVVLKDRERADAPFDLEVGVDRGVATYPYPLPDQSARDFLDDRYKGWGQRANEKSSPAYVEMTGTPSATVTVSQGGESLGSVRWGDVVEEGAAETAKVRIELTEPGRNWVDVSVVDDDTGRPVPCRVHFRSPDGVPYQPYGHHNHVNSGLDTFNYDVGGDLRMGQVTYAYINGTCQGWLPRGEVIVDVARGFEYEPIRRSLTIEPGQRELTLRLKRWTDMNRRGWYSGDSHVHFLSAQGALHEAQAEDLNVVNLLQCQWGSLFTGTEEFTGEPHVSRRGDSVVYVCQENRQHLMGHMILMGLKRHVMPWCTDGPGEAEIGGTMESTLSAWADQCHEQGGTVAAAHFWGLNREAAAMIATGRLDAIEFKGHQNRFPHEEYYRVLNCGYRIPLVGGTDKMSSEVAIGHWRTYAKLEEDEEFTYDNWRRSVERGRTFMTSGPDHRAQRRRPRDRRHGRHIGAGHRRGERRGRERAAHTPARHRAERLGRGVRRVEGGRANPSFPRRRDSIPLQARAAGERAHRRPLVAGRALREPGLLRRSGLRRHGARNLRPHVAGLRRVRWRVADVRRGHCRAHAHRRQGRHRLHPRDVGPVPERQRHPPPRRTRPPGLARTAISRGPGGA